MVDKIGKGELIDTQAWNKDKDEDGNRDLDLYMQTLALKYPTMALANKKSVSTSLLSVKPSFIRRTNPIKKKQPLKEDTADYMGEASTDPVKDELLKLYDPQLHLDKESQDSFNFNAIMRNKQVQDQNQKKNNLDDFMEQYSMHGIGNL